jgi:hypothetical protein
MKWHLVDSEGDRGPPVEDVFEVSASSPGQSGDPSNRSGHSATVPSCHQDTAPTRPHSGIGQRDGKDALQIRLA